MLTVIFDTNILHQEGLKPTRMQMFQRLLNTSKIKLILPEIVIEEFRSKRISIAEEELSTIKKCIDTLQRKEILQRGISTLESTCKDCVEKISEDIDSWIKTYKIEIYDISNTCIDKLFKDYFLGRGVFNEKKKREDIPDALIYDAIKTISEKTEVHLITKDRRLIEAVKKNNSVKFFSDLEEFLSIQSIKDTIIELDRKESNISSILEYLDSVDATCHLESYINEAGINNLDNTFSSDMIKAVYFDDLSMIDAELIALNQDQEKEIYSYNPSYLGNNTFCLYFSFDSMASIRFTSRCHEDDFDYFPRKLSKAIKINPTKDSDILEISGILDVTFVGVIIMSNISEELSPKELDIHFSYIGNKDCEISCSVSIESVNISYI